jgi:hypothetical protein
MQQIFRPDGRWGGGPEAVVFMMLNSLGDRMRTGRLSARKMFPQVGAVGFRNLTPSD